MCYVCFLVFFNDAATPEIYTLSVHDALPIYGLGGARRERQVMAAAMLEHADQAVLDIGVERGVLDLVDLIEGDQRAQLALGQDRKSTRLNSSHMSISYAVFCLKKKTDI